jgi:hypothetical protein
MDGLEAEGARLRKFGGQRAYKTINNRFCRFDGSTPGESVENEAIPEAAEETRRVEGESVPMGTLAEMERCPAESMKVRDQMLNNMAWGPKGTSWAEWKASSLNGLFSGARSHGAAGPPHGRHRRGW